MSEITTIGIDLAKNGQSAPSALETIVVNSWGRAGVGWDHRRGGSVYCT